MPATVDTATLWRPAEMPALDMLSAKHTSHAFPRHHHVTFVIQAVEDGTDEFETNGQTWSAPAGSLVLLNPYQVHTGRASHGTCLQYRALYPHKSLTDLRFREAVVDDPQLAQALIAGHRALERDPNSSAAFAHVMAATRSIVQRHASPTQPLSTKNKEAAYQARALIARDITARLTLDQLSDRVSMSPFHLQRLFLREFGQTPQEFLVNARIETAKRLLKLGKLPVEISYALGFADQGHFTRNFKQLVGVTPGGYQKRKIVQA